MCREKELFTVSLRAESLVSDHTLIIAVRPIQSLEQEFPNVELWNAYALWSGRHCRGSALRFVPSRELSREDAQDVSGAKISRDISLLDYAIDE